MHADRTVTDGGLRTRRALSLMVMSAVVPGSAQYVAGNRAVGRLAMRVWVGAVVLVLLSVLGVLLLRGPLLAFLLAPGVTTVLRVAAWTLFAGWALLLLDAWRLARPIRLERPARLALTVSCVALVSVVGFTTNIAASALTAADNVSTVLKGGGEKDQKAGRYNILLLGVDAAAHREGIRPDSINVASVDAETGRTVVFGLPRNLQGAPFPDESPLHALYPNGFRCEDDACMLNGVLTLGEDNADLYPGEEAGLQAMLEVTEETLGLDINYYAMVDMAGFTHLIDAVGGISLNLNRDVPMGGGTSPISGYVRAGENIHLDGHEALWVARSREGSSDYERMTRQKCVMSAMTKELDASVMVRRFVELSEAGRDIVVTDVGAGHLAELAELAMRAKALELESVDFSPPLITTADPDFPLIRSTVTDSIRASEAKDDSAAATEESSPTPAAATPAKDRPAAVESATDAQDVPSQMPSDGDGAASRDDKAPSVEDEQDPAETTDVPPICSVS